MLDAVQGRLLNIAKTGMHPRAIAQDGACVAVAGGATGDVMILDSKTLRVLGVYKADGITCGCCFFAGQLMIMCMAGEYDVGTVVGAISPDGKWTPWVKLPGLPGAMTPCGGGLLVGHLNGLTMLDAPNGRIRWQTKIAGLPSAVVPVERFACFMDSLEGMIGLVELRRGTIMRRLGVGEPGGIAVL
jgi:outer membrane protein assembly factor BamB